MKKIAQKETRSIAPCRKLRIVRPGRLHLSQKDGCGKLATLPPGLRSHPVIENLSVHFPEGPVVKLRFRKEQRKEKAQNPDEDCYSLSGIGIGLEFVGLGMEAVREIEKELSRFSLPLIR